MGFVMDSVIMKKGVSWVPLLSLTSYHAMNATYVVLQPGKVQ